MVFLHHSHCRDSFEQLLLVLKQTESWAAEFKGCRAINLLLQPNLVSFPVLSPVYIKALKHQNTYRFMDLCTSWSKSAVLFWLSISIKHISPPSTIGGHVCAQTQAVSHTLQSYVTQSLDLLNMFRFHLNIFWSVFQHL